MADEGDQVGRSRERHGRDQEGERRRQRGQVAMGETAAAVSGIVAAIARGTVSGVLMIGAAIAARIVGGFVVVVVVAVVVMVVVMAVIAAMAAVTEAIAAAGDARRSAVMLVVTPKRVEADVDGRGELESEEPRDYQKAGDAAPRCPSPHLAFLRTPPPIGLPPNRSAAGGDKRARSH